jgi:hypothetical protein
MDGYKFTLLDRNGAVWEEEVVLRVPAPEAILQLNRIFLPTKKPKVYRECESAEASVPHELTRALTSFP